MPKRNSRYSMSGVPVKRIAYYLKIGGHEAQVSGTAFYSLERAGLITIKKREQKVVIGLIAALKSHYHTGHVAGEAPFLRALLLDPILPPLVAKELESRLGRIIRKFGLES